MTNEMKLLTAFIEASGFDIEILTPKAEDFKWQFKGQPSNNLTPLCVDYKVTKKKTTRKLCAEERLNHATGRMGNNESL